MFGIFKVTPAADLIKEASGGLQGKEKPKPVQAPEKIENIWDSKLEMRTIFFDAKGEGIKPVENRESRLTDADIKALAVPYGLWPKKRDAQTKYHEAKALWAQGKSAKEISQILGMSLSVAGKATAAFNSVHENI